MAGFENPGPPECCVIPKRGVVPPQEGFREQLRPDSRDRDWASPRDSSGFARDRLSLLLSRGSAGDDVADEG